ncbi:hypothetical protein [Azospirillum sp. SYSU D00513]|uniref:hypothetical protein n=1 Tax=Azospirillum sp. SYSU D00513 TaxID=2812561 RepID=UPI001A968E62|nr:hypothetical protein [Azospirillum sp. SYSU D00513]
MTDTVTPTATVTVSQATATSHTVQPIAAVRDSTGVLASARSHDGGLVMKALAPTDRVTVQGVEMTLEQAESRGFVRRGPDGQYQDASHEEIAKRVDERYAKEQPEDDLSEALEVDNIASETFSNWSGAIKSIGANPVAVLGEVVMNPDRIPEALQMLAKSHGIPFSKVQEDIRYQAASVEDAVNRYVAGFGATDSDGFWAYVNANVPKMDLASIFTRALFLGDASGFKDLAHRYVYSKPSADIPTVKVNVGGRETKTDIITARRMGLRIG